MALKQELYDTIDPKGLYICEPRKGIRDRLHDDNLMHCCNWHFVPKFYENGEIWMTDTYWTSDSTRIKLSDDNFDWFTKVFNFNEVKKINQSEAKYYDCKVHHVALDSGGFYCGGQYFVAKYAEHSIDLEIKAAQEEIESAEWKLNYSKRKLEQLIEKKNRSDVS